MRILLEVELGVKEGILVLKWQSGGFFLSPCGLDCNSSTCHCRKLWWLGRWSGRCNNSDAKAWGPNRAFGDLIAASGITEVQIESLIVMKDLEGVEGLPPLREIEDARLARLERKSIRGQLEQQRQEETAKARVRQVDEKGRAYGTGRRKCSVARVWIQPGIGRFIVNEKPFDAYFTQLAHRADLLAPFDKTKTLGLWDIFSTVKGGGVSGQVGAVRLGISRALQNWEPGLRPYLRSAGLLTRDPRMVERKKPGKAKARKSFQWVKR